MPETDDQGYDEEHWERAFAAAASATPGDESEPPEFAGDAGGAADANLPSLEESLKKIPEETKALVDALFRGQFTQVKRIDQRYLR